MDGGIAPALVKEAAVAVERFEEVEVGLRAQPVEVSDLEVGPLDEYRVSWNAEASWFQGWGRETYEVTAVVGFAVVVAQPAH